MTREQAINSMISHGFTVEQAGEIIKAVTLQEPTTKNCESCRYYGSHHKACNYCYKCSLWTEGEPTTKNDLGFDCISRQAVLELIADYDLSMGQVVKGIHALPSVTPQEPVIDKIRNEIERQREKVSEKHSDDEELQTYYNGLNDGLKDSRDICDKYKAETEE